MERLWFKYWPEGVPRHINYPSIPLYELLANSAKNYPDGIAFICGEDHLTFAQLDRTSSQLAAFLNQSDIASKDKVLILLPNSLEYATGFYGILKAGAIVSAANPLYKESELKHQLIDSGATAIITNRDSYPLVKRLKNETNLKVVILTDGSDIDAAVWLGNLLQKYEPLHPTTVSNPREEVASIEYTGGTTGLPKGVMLTHYNMVANAIQNATWFNWSRKDVIMGILPFYHSWGACTCVISPVYCGARVIAMPRFNIETLLDTVTRERATVLYGAASMFITLANSPLIEKYDLSCLRYVKAGAMLIPPEIKEQWEKKTGVEMVLGYGLSEASPETHNSPRGHVKAGTIGIPIMDTDARIVDKETGKIELPVGETGELTIKAPQVMKGYLNQPRDTETVRNGWLYTGDLAFMDKEGYFHISGRKKETIKYKGYTIAPAEVEAAIYEHPSVSECVVIGKPAAHFGEIPKAFVVVREGCSLDADELIEFCKQRLSPFKRIREVEFIDEIPKTSVGKVLRRVLKERENI